MSPTQLRLYLFICLLNFGVAALLGLALRYSSMAWLPIQYSHFTHAHSHTAMLGWAYQALFCLLVYFFLPQGGRKYRRLFWATQLSVFGIMGSFPVQGYGPVSIAFSTLHTIFAYIFVLAAWREALCATPEIRRLLRTALVFFVLSTLGVWCLPPCLLIWGKDSTPYQLAIQFYLHFQFNGWFTAAIGALYMQWRHQQFGPVLQQSFFKNFWYLFSASTVLSFFLPVSWYVPEAWVASLNGLGLLLQLGALYYFLKWAGPKQRPFTSRLSRILFLFLLSGLLLKVLFQSLTFLPLLADMAQIRSYRIGFIHVSMLAFLSGFLLLTFAELLQWHLQKGIAFVALTLFVSGFLLTELLLFTQAFAIPCLSTYIYFRLLFAGSLLLFSGIFGFIILLWRR